MTRKDYELIAAAIKRCADGNGAGSNVQPPMWTIHEVACELGNALKITNPLFDRERFLKACGVE